MPDERLLTIVVPVYNEMGTIRSSLERLSKTELPVATEIVVVDDGSSDGGPDSIMDLVDGTHVRLIKHRSNQGKGAAVRSGIEAARGGLLTICDADLEYDPADYAALLQPVLDGEATVVYGTRSFGAHTAFSFWYVLGNKFLGYWASMLFNTWLSDVETCFKLAPTALWRSFGLTSPGFGIEAEVTGKLLAGGHRIYEVPIRYKARSRGEGKKLHWTDGVEALTILLRIRLGLMR